jgi:hypothetical protein
MKCRYEDWTDFQNTLRIQMLINLVTELKT